MKVTEVKLFKSQKPGLVKAYGKATLDDELALDVLIMDKCDGKGAWVTFPGGRKDAASGKYFVPVFFKTKEKNEEFRSEVLKAYGEMAETASASNTGAQQDELPF